ncbi:MAG: DNA internalization-related competence protein ComEC/Rec2 [Legionellales bacterium]
MEIFCLVMGVLYLYTATSYLPLACLLVFFVTPRYPIILFFVLGMLLAWVHQWFNKTQGMPDLEVLPQVRIQGTIASIPVHNAHKTQFSFAIDQLDSHPAQGLVQIAWYNHAPIIHAGQRWQLDVKLKKPRNFRNPGSYNYSGALATKHLSWTGYIRSKNNQLLEEAHAAFDWLEVREHLGNSLGALAHNQQTAGILEALTLNLTNQIAQEQWDLFRRTGTTHLFGISGEHIALISGLIFWLFQGLWSRCQRLCLRIPALYAASVAGLSTALVYAFLAGFGPPVQRALIGCFFYTLCCLGRQKFSSWQIWRYALMAVVCFEPHAVFMQGFYFSFLAVACLLLTQQRWGLKGYKSTLALQLSCLIGLMPLTLYWFSYGSINGFIANLFAIPLVGLLIVPLALVTLSVCTYSWAWVLMKPLSWLISLLLKGLVWTEQFDFVNINWSLNTIEWVIAFMGSLLLGFVLPIQPFKKIALLWFLLPFIPHPPLIHKGEALIRVLDVGQGLAVSIQTQNRVLLYDTGDQFFNGGDLGTMVILPYYKAMHVKKIDKIIISHPDRDHKGGLASIEANLPVDELLVNDISRYSHGVKCHEYPKWQWDGVDFRFIPIGLPVSDKNNSSCVLQVRTAAGRVLLSGDIEKKAESYLVRTYGSDLRSEVLILPHHGSKTSSSYRFLLEVAPTYGIASLGFDNRFGFPHAKTMASLEALGIAFYRTDECGMIEVVLPIKGQIHEPKCPFRT